MNMAHTILTVTGSDGSGGSGLQADIRCINELGGIVTSAITSITVQNTLGIQEFYDLPATTVRSQIEAILNDLQPQVVKIGLLRRTDVVSVVVELMRKYRPRYIVYAPVLHSVRGDLLVEPQVYQAIRQQLFPFAPSCSSPPTCLQAPASTVMPTNSALPSPITSVVVRASTRPCYMPAVTSV